MARLRRFDGCPWGYRVADDTGALEEDPGEQSVLHIVRHMHANGKKLSEIVRMLNDLGVTGRNGKPIGKTRIFEMAHGGRSKK